MLQWVQAVMPILAAAAGMDRIDWSIFAVASCVTPLSAWLNFRLWNRARAHTRAADWQSFWMMLLGTVCMIGIVGWYLFKFILRASA